MMMKDACAPVCMRVLYYNNVATNDVFYSN